MTITPALTSEPEGASQTICRSATSKGAESCTERAAINCPRQGTRTKNSPLCACEAGRSMTLRVRRICQTAKAEPAAKSRSTAKRDHVRVRFTALIWQPEDLLPQRDQGADADR